MTPYNMGGEQEDKLQEAQEISTGTAAEQGNYEGYDPGDGGGGGGEDD